MSSCTYARTAKGESLLTWEAAAQIPWGVLILFGGGLTIAAAFTESGLSQLVGDSLAGISAFPILLMIGMICLVVTFLTEVTSNTATATLLLPILAVAALSAEIEPKLLMIPAAISCSFAFMLPVATPPNAIVFGSERLTTRQMSHEGTSSKFGGRCRCYHGLLVDVRLASNKFDGESCNLGPIVVRSHRGLKNQFEV